MASFPYVFESNFEVGSASEWTATVGTQVAVESYKELSRQRKWGVPFRGAYALQATFGVDTDSYVRSTTIAIGSGSSAHSRVMLYIGKDVEATTTTEVVFYEHLPAIASVGLRIESGGDIFFGIRSGSAALTVSTIALERGKYYTVELHADTTNTNTCTARIVETGDELTTANGEATAATTEGRLGVIGVGAGSLAAITGTITLDGLVHDSARVYGHLERFPQRQLISKTAHAFISAGRIDDIQLIAGAGTDCVLEIYDTDSADTNPENLVAKMTNIASEEAVSFDGRVPLYVFKGAYVVLSGTDPRALIQIGPSSAYGNEAVIRSIKR